jgi:hypothetical protein
LQFARDLLRRVDTDWDGVCRDLATVHSLLVHSSGIKVVSYVGCSVLLAATPPRCCCCCNALCEGGVSIRGLLLQCAMTAEY